MCREHGIELLLWEPSMGWDELCMFLDTKVPERPLPRNNDRAKMEKIVGCRISVGLKLWAQKLAVPVVLLGGWSVIRALTIASTG